MILLSRSSNPSAPPRQAVRSSIYDAAKRVIDLLAAGAGLLVLSPLMLVLALAVRIDDPGPVLFRQQRIGRNGKRFTMLKFRTMALNAPNISTKAMQDLGVSYVTRVGALLRRTSLDELPQLWNILKGDMSIVGPRPALYNQDLLTSLRDAADVLAVRPGITGLAQISGRDELDIPTKVAYDWEYLRDRSLPLDVSIVWQTLTAVVSNRGNY